MTSPKKRDKMQAKLAKKKAKAEIKAHKGADQAKPASAAVRFAEHVRGFLYLLTSVSLIVALVLGQRGVIMSLDDLIDSLFAVWAGKVVLSLIAVGLLIYGLKHLRLVR